MYIDKVWLENFRNYQSAEVSFPQQGLTIVHGLNGQGKTNLLEALGYVSSLRSFRGVPPGALVRFGETTAVLRSEGQRDQRSILVECELASEGRNRTLFNRQSFHRNQHMSQMILSTVFSPDDLALVKGGPAERRRYIDDLLLDTDSKMESTQKHFERVLRQRNTLLRQSAGRLSADVKTTLDVWDAKMAEVGEVIGDKRAEIINALRPLIADSYSHVSCSPGTAQRVGLSMVSYWRQANGGKGLLEALSASRNEDVARGVTTVGPHRDDLDLTINDLPARTHSSQGEQRTLSLALRLASHHHLTEVCNASPLLLLDDVFSELDAGRAERLLTGLAKAKGQIFLTAASTPAIDIEADLELTVKQGRIE